MSRFLIASWDGGGNTPSAFHLGSRLVRQGHRVRVLGWAPMAARAAEIGLDFSTYPTVPPWPEGVVHEDAWDLLHECLAGGACQADVVAAARTFGADVMIVDCMLAAGFAAGRDLDLPTAALVHVSYQQFLHVWGDRAMETDVRVMLADSAVVLALQPPGFDPACPMPPGHEYVGAIMHPDTGRNIDDQLRAALGEPGDPWCLVSLSTTTQHGQRETLQAILDALAATPVRVLLTLGGSASASALRLPANAVASGFVPHELVLPWVSVVVTHAGMSTVAVTLAAGVPMVCVPQGRDQGGNAERVVAIGAGLNVDALHVGAAVSTLLADPRYRTSAQRIARACNRLRGGEHAADLVGALADHTRLRADRESRRSPLQVNARTAV